jgi:hypothetical protein
LPPTTLPSIGPVIIWQTPGYFISGLSNSASLTIEVLARPVKDSTPQEQRVLWYWDPATDSVEPAASDFHVLGTGGRFVTLTPGDEMAPPPFLLAQSLAGHQNSHNHGLSSYALDDSASPADGAYGFFARLLSPDPLNPSLELQSNPFLIVVNLNVDYDEMGAAALAINAAAVNSLPGDFNLDGSVDAADYVAWRKNADTSDKYDDWRDHFGESGGGGGGFNFVSAGPAANAPEPLLWQLILPIAGLLASIVRKWPR